MIFPLNRKTPERMQPHEQALDLPATFVASELSSVLGRGSFPIALMRRNQFDPAFFSQALIKFITVISLVANDHVRRIGGKTAIHRIFNKPHFVGRSAFNVSGDRKTRYGCDRHDLGAFAALCLADSKTPFFAGAKQPSMKASRISIWPRSYRSSTSSWAMHWKIPSRTHCWNQRWHVWYGGYRWGRSFHGAPVRRIHRIPFITSRGSRGLRPLGSLIGVKDTIMGSIRFHCSFVSSILILLHNQAFMSRFILR